MGNKNKQKQYEQSAAAAEAERAAKAKQLDEGSSEYKAYAARVGERRKAIDTGDINGATDFIGNSANQALINRKREAVWNAAPTGMQAIGNRYANPNQMALQTQMLKDQQSRDSAGQLESDWKDYIGDTQAAESGIVAQRDGIDTSLMNAASQRWNQNDQMARQMAAQRQQMWAGLLGAGIGGASSILTGGLSSGGFLNRSNLSKSTSTKLFDKYKTPSFSLSNQSVYT